MNSKNILVDGRTTAPCPWCTGRGAFIEDISASDLDVSGMTGGFLCLNILNSGIQDQSPVPGDEGIPTIRNFRFSDVRVKDCPTLVDGVRIHPNRPLDGFSLVNVTGTCRKGISLANVKKTEIRNVKVTGLMGPLVSIHNVFRQGSQRRRERRSTETARSSCGAEPAVSASLSLEPDSRRLLQVRP